MNESEREVSVEYIDDETKEYVLSKGIERGEWKFYLRFITESFTPCKICQQRLSDQIQKSKNFILGNATYEPPIELNYSWQVDDNSWKEIIRHRASKEQLETLIK